MSPALNPLAQAFKPAPVNPLSSNSKKQRGSSGQRRSRRRDHRSSDGVGQVQVTDEEQQAMYEWLCLMVELENLENEHLIEMAIQHTPADQLHKLEAKYTDVM